MRPHPIHLFLVGVLGCGAPPSPSPTPATPVAAGPDLPADVPPERPPAVEPTPAGKAMGAANNRFALDFYAKLREKPGNLFVSPLSLHAALTVTAAGANGQTLAEMRQVLHLPAEPDAGYANLLAATIGDRPGYQLRTANAVWGQKGCPWKRPFLDRLTAGFGAALREADFIEEPDAERLRINTWAEEQTAGRIKDLLAKGKISRSVRMVLVNAVYFKGEWAEQFDAKQTRPAAFTRADGSKADVPMMHRTGGFRLFVDHSRDQWVPNFWVTELPYRGGEASLVLVVPGKPDGLPALEAKLTPEELQKCLTAAHADTDSDLYLPKFKLETKYEEPVEGSILRSLGMSTAFIDGEADFSAMLNVERLHIGLVVQKTFVDVNEEGTEAAAATAVVMKGEGASPSYRADRPFLFLIRHNPTGAILFLGRYAGP